MCGGVAESVRWEAQRVRASHRVIAGGALGGGGVRLGGEGGLKGVRGSEELMSGHAGCGPQGGETDGNSIQRWVFLVNFKCFVFAASTAFERVLFCELSSGKKQVNIHKNKKI